MYRCIRLSRVHCCSKLYYCINGVDFFPLPTCPDADGARLGQEVGERMKARERSSLPSRKILTLKELNARSVDPSLVRDTVLHFLQRPRTLRDYHFLGLGMASARHSDIHLVMNICETVGDRGARPGTRTAGAEDVATSSRRT